MKVITGTTNRILEINLSDQSVIQINVSEEDIRMYLGGKGLGLKLLYDRMKPGSDPLGEENYLAFMMGVLMGTGAPCSGRFAALTKSPLTGIMVASSCGGPFGMALKTAGWDGLLITGKSSQPNYLDITANGVEFKSARDLWGKDIPDVQAILDRKKGGEPGRPCTTCIVIQETPLTVAMHVVHEGPGIRFGKATGFCKRRDFRRNT